MKHTLHRRLIAGVVAGAAAILLAGCERPGVDMAAGEQLVQDKGCVACHGTDGEGVGPTFPNIGGQWPSYLRTQLKKYREGDRVDAVMNVQAEGLTDAEIDLLAEYYAAQ